MADSRYRYRGLGFAEDDEAFAKPRQKKRLRIASLRELFHWYAEQIKHCFLRLSGSPFEKKDLGDVHESASAARHSRSGWSLLGAVGSVLAHLLLLPMYLIVIPIRRVFGLDRIARLLRNRQDLFWGLPAVLVGAVAIVFCILVQNAKGSLPGQYRYRALSASEHNNLPLVELYLQRLMRLKTDDEQMQFSYARILESKGDTGRAVAIISNLAPLDGMGYPPAHLWIANRILSDPNSTDANRQTCRHHLRIAEREMGGENSVHVALANFHLYLAGVEDRDENLQVALRHLETAAVDQPGLYYRIAIVQEEFSEMDAAAESYARAEQHLRLAIEQNQADHNARIGLAGSLLKLSRFDEARTVLEEGMAIDSTQPYDRLLSEAIVHIFDRQVASHTASDAELFALLIEAMRINPKSVSAASRLLHYGVNSDNINSRAVAIEGLVSFLAQGEGVAMAHLLLGIHYFSNEGDTDTSMLHLKTAYALDSTMTASANNFAWLLAHQEPPDYERALALIDSILADDPDNANFLDTRGHILLGLGRWEEAYRELERALPVLKENPDTHDALARVYTHFGDHALAERHQTIAQDLRSEQRDVLAY